MNNDLPINEGFAKLRFHPNPTIAHEAENWIRQMDGQAGQTLQLERESLREKLMLEARVGLKSEHFYESTACVLDTKRKIGVRTGD